MSRTGSDTRVTIPGGTLPQGDVEVQGASKSAAGLPATDAELVWSGSQFTEAALPPANLVFTIPTAGAALTGPTADFTVSVPDLDALQYRVLGDLLGQPDESNVVDPGGTKTTGDLRTFTVTGLQNSSTVHVQARPILDSLTVPYTSRQHPVTFTPPAEPIVSDQPVRLGSAPGGESDAIAVRMLNPLPTGGAPAVAFNRLRRRVEAVGGDGILLENPATGQVLEVAPRATYFDGSVPHGVAVQYRAEAFAVERHEHARPLVVRARRRRPGGPEHSPTPSRRPSRRPSDGPDRGRPPAGRRSRGRCAARAQGRRHPRSARRSARHPRPSTPATDGSVPPTVEETV